MYRRDWEAKRSHLSDLIIRVCKCLPFLITVPLMKKACHIGRRHNRFVPSPRVNILQCAIIPFSCSRISISSLLHVWHCHVSHTYDGTWRMDDWCQGKRKQPINGTMKRPMLFSSLAMSVILGQTLRSGLISPIMSVCAQFDPPIPCIMVLFVRVYVLVPVLMERHTFHGQTPSLGMRKREADGCWRK